MSRLKCIQILYPFGSSFLSRHRVYLGDVQKSYICIHKTKVDTEDMKTKFQADVIAEFIFESRFNNIFTKQGRSQQIVYTHSTLRQSIFHTYLLFSRCIRRYLQWRLWVTIHFVVINFNSLKFKKFMLRGQLIINFNTIKIIMSFFKYRFPCDSFWSPLGWFLRKSGRFCRFLYKINTTKLVILKSDSPVIKSWLASLLIYQIGNILSN